MNCFGPPASQEGRVRQTLSPDVIGYDSVTRVLATAPPEAVTSKA